MPTAPTPDRFARRVLAELARRRTTWGAFADQVGLTRSEVRYWLLGQRSLRSDKVCTVAQALGFDLLPRKGKPPRRALDTPGLAGGRDGSRVVQDAGTQSRPS